MYSTAELSTRTGIPEAVLAQIASAGRQWATRVVLFGSRARGDHRPRSDMDIAFYGNDTGYLAFAEAMEQLPTLLEFDCVHITDHTSPDLIHNIQKEGIPLMSRAAEKTAQLQSAVSRLKEAIVEYEQTHSQAVRDGAIQRFEFSAELAWKATQDYLEEQGYLDVHSPKAVMRKAYLEGLVTDEQGWLSLLDARNKTSHLYDDIVVDQIYQQIQGTYLPLLDALMERLEQ